MNLGLRHWNGCVRASAFPARHAVTVLGYQVAGDVEMEHDGIQVLEPGDLYVIPAGEPHRARAAHDAEVWTLAFAPHRLADARFDDVRGARGRVTISPERRAFVTSLFVELTREKAGPTLRQESLLALLLEELRAERPPPTHDLASRAIALIAAHALEPLSLADVASALGKNRTHVADVVRAATGQTVGTLIAELRLDEARRRLEDTDELVEVIGERVGYTDPTHFARMFRRRYGRSPRAWRTIRT